MLSLTAVTPWWNHRELERDYWQAVGNEDIAVIVVDNGSEPRLPNGWRLDTNRGFSHACNVGLNLARTDAVLFLNNDIAMVTPGWANVIRAALEPGVLVGAQLRHDQHGDIDGHPCPYLDGWCVAGMREDLVDLGGWDEDYMEPSYFGDNDLSLRARAAGMRLREVQVGLHHKLNQTAGRTAAVSAATIANRERFTERARGILSAA